MQNNIEDILSRNSIIPVVTIHDFHQIDAVYDQLMKQDIKCIEITLRTDYAWEAIAEFKLKYGCEIKVFKVILVYKVYKDLPQEMLQL